MYTGETGADALFTRRFWLACAMHFAGGMAASFYILFPLFVRSLGGTEVAMGLYAGLSGAAAVAARVPVGKWLDTRGRRRVLVAAGALSVAAWLSFVSISSIGMASATLVLVYGFAGGALFAGYFTYASDIVPMHRRSEGFGMFGIWGMLPNGLGPWLGERLIAGYGFHAYFGVAALFAFTALCISTRLPETVHGPHTVANAAEPPASGTFPGRELLFLLATTFMFGVAMESLFVFLAPFAYGHGHGNVGFFFMTYAWTAVAVRVISGRLPDRIGLRRVLVPALLVYACGVLWVPHASTTALVAIGMLCGIGHGYAFPILNALAVEQVSAAYRGRAVSWLTAMFDLGNTLANPALGAVAHWAGYTAMFSTSGVALLLAVVAVWWRSAPSRQSSPVHRAAL